MNQRVDNWTLYNNSEEAALPPRNNVTYVGFYLHHPSTAAIFIVSYLLIFLVCMAGNGVVCFIVLRSRNMRTVTNLFILNLAVSDLLVGIFCMPTTLLDNIITGWPFGSLVCKMSGMVQGISVSASVFTLVAIAVDRFRCIVYPFKQKLTISTATLIIVIIWVLAISIMCPSGVMLQGELAQPGDAQDLHHRVVRQHLPGSAVPHRRHVRSHRHHALQDRRAHGRQAGSRQPTRRLQEEAAGHQDAPDRGLALHPVLAAPVDPHDAERLRPAHRAAVPHRQHLRLPLCPLAGVFQQQRQPHHLRILQRELPPGFPGGVQVQPVRGRRAAEENVLAPAAAQLCVAGQ
ncbi:neuropeptide FF receptor 2a isoform X2 [Festucalex cinctus]